MTSQISAASQVDNSPETAISENERKETSTILLKFPSDLGSLRNRHVMQFRGLDIFKNAKKTDKDHAVVASDEITDPVVSIYLPTPASLNTNYGGKYEDVERGQVAAGVGTGNLSGEGGSVGSFAQQLDGFFKIYENMKDKGVLERAARESLASMVEQFSGEMVMQSDATARGYATRAYEVSSFKGMYMRDFSYSFHMVARNKDESDAIDNIVHQFKKGMHPGISGDSAKINYPYQWKIGFIRIADSSIERNEEGERNYYLYQPGICYLMDMGVTYNGSGTPSFFKDSGAPVEVDITLKFMERDILVRENFGDSAQNASDVFNGTSLDKPVSQKFRSPAY